MAWQRSMVYGLGQLLSEERADVGTVYIQADQVGSPSILTDVGGNLVGRTKGLPFGERGWQSGSQSARRYTNHEDQPSSPIYMQARMYLPAYGRFAQPDPAYDQAKLDPESWNLYGYVTNNPVTHTDPDGRMITPDPKSPVFVEPSQVLGMWMPSHPGWYNLTGPDTIHVVGFSSPTLFYDKAGITRTLALGGGSYVQGAYGASNIVAEVLISLGQIGNNSSGYAGNQNGVNREMLSDGTSLLPLFAPAKNQLVTWDQCQEWMGEMMKNPEFAREVRALSAAGWSGIQLGNTSKIEWLGETRGLNTIVDSRKFDPSALKEYFMDVAAHEIRHAYQHLFDTFKYGTYIDYKGNITWEKLNRSQLNDRIFSLGPQGELARPSEIDARIFGNWISREFAQ